VLRNRVELLLDALLLGHQDLFTGHQLSRHQLDLLVPVLGLLLTDTEVTLPEGIAL
jgi:hypothetical protein